MLQFFFTILTAAAQSAGASGDETPSAALTTPPPAITAPAAPEPTAPAASEQVAAAPAPEPEPEPETTPEPAAAPEPAPQQPAAAAPVTGIIAPAAPELTPGLVAEPQTATGRFLTATEVRPILNATKPNWISVRAFGGKDLLYVTHIWSWRCGLLELRVGVNGAQPEIWPLPACHTDQPAPAAILESDGLPYREFPLKSVQLIEVMLTFDDLSVSRVRFNRAGIVIP